MKILYFGIYDPEYSRNRVLIKGLKENGLDVIECRVENKFGWKIKLFFKYLFADKNYDFIVVGFPSHEVVKFMYYFMRKPIVADVFTSHFGGYILDRKKYPEKSKQAIIYKELDKNVVNKSAIAILDTEENIDFFVENFSLDRNKFVVVNVGTDTSVMKPSILNKNNDRFLVHFHGSFIPLQGIEYIIESAKLLEDLPIDFRIIGKGQTYDEMIGLSEKLETNNIEFAKPVPYADLPKKMGEADVCLGVFGNNEKTGIVIPNKVFEALACAKPVISAETRAMKRYFSHKQNIIFCKRGDSESLAEAIKMVFYDKELRKNVGENGYKLFLEKFQEKDVVKPLINRLNYFYEK